MGYPKSLLNEDHLTSLNERITGRAVRSGKRAPDDEVTHRGETTSLFPFFYNADGCTTGWALLCFDGRSDKAGPAIIDVVRAVAPWESVRPRLVLAGTLVEGGNVPVLSDMDGKAHGAYGFEGEPALVLVRPDGQVAFQGDADRPDRLIACCRKVFGPERAGN